MTEAELREHCTKQQRTIGKMGVKLKELERLEADREKAEHAMRDMLRERDHWKDRALAAEAALASLGEETLMIEPPPPGMSIDRSPNPWWKT